MRRMTIGAALMLAGCVHLPGHHDVPRGGETITYAAERCYGRCPAYAVTLGPDGQGIFTGEANTAVTGDRRFAATPGQVRDFTAALEKVRPDRERLVQPGSKACGPAATDQASIDVRWQGAGAGSHLRLYLGCRSKKALSLRRALQGLPLRSLPLQPFLGSD